MLKLEAKVFPVYPTFAVILLGKSFFNCDVNNLINNIDWGLEEDTVFSRYQENCPPKKIAPKKIAPQKIALQKITPQKIFP